MTRTLIETEVEFIKYFDVEKLTLVTEFHGLSEIDRSDSSDGKSCDAEAIFQSYKRNAEARAPGSFSKLREAG